jgi:hypothetical protein
MPKEDFLMSVRTAVGTVLPRVDADHPYPNRDELEGIFRKAGADLWLTRSAVAGFDRSDFDDLDLGTLDTLDKDISKFIEIATLVNPTGRATEAQFKKALPLFLEIAEIVRAYTLNEWLQAARTLIDQAEEWAKAKGWPTKRILWSFTELHLGEYELHRLIYAVMGSQMALIPVGRFMMRSKGSFDLAVMPAYETVSISRNASGRWTIEPLPGENMARTWKPIHFVEVSEKLARMG